MTTLQAPVLLLGKVEVHAASAPRSDAVLELLEDLRLRRGAHQDLAHLVDSVEVVVPALPERCLAVFLNEVDRLPRRARGTRHGMDDKIACNSGSCR